MQKKTRTLWLLGVGLVVATAAIAGGNPKFLRAPSATIESPTGKVASKIDSAGPVVEGPVLVIGWTETGLGNTGTINYTATADAAAVYQCVNLGTNCPSAANKQDVAAKVSTSATFAIDNGRISGELRLEAPPPTLSCPGNQVVAVASVVFTNILLEDTTNHISAATKPSSISYQNTAVCP